MENKTISLKLLKIVIILQIIVSFVAIVLTPHSFIANNIYKVNSLNNEVYTYNDKNEKISFNSFGKKTDAKELDIYFDLNESDVDEIAIGTYNYYQALSVYENDELIYSYGTKDDLNNNVRLGNKYCKVNIKFDNGSTTTIRLHFESNNDLVIYNIDEADTNSLDLYQFLETAPVILLTFTSIVTLLIIGFILINKHYTYISKNLLMWIGHFILTSTLWIIADSQLLIILGLDAGVTCQISFELYPIFSLSLLKIVELLTDNHNKYVQSLYVISIINYFVLNILDIFNIKPFLETLLTTHIITVLIIICIVSLLSKEFKKNHTTRNAILFYGFLAFIICAIAQYVFFFINPSENNSYLLILGIGILYTTLVIDIMHIIRLEQNRNNEEYKKKIEEANLQLEKRNKQLFKTFGRFVPDSSIKNLVDKDINDSIDGTIAYCTILDLDIRGFTDLIANMDPADVIEILNNFLTRMTAIIGKYHGTVIEYVGDSIIASFGAPIKDENHASLAIAAALEMQEDMKVITEYNLKNNYPTYEIGIGLATGNVYIGYLGSNLHMKFDVIGNTVNLCARIQGYTIGGQVLISEETYKLSKNIDVEDINKVLPKGYDEPINIYSITGIGDPYNVTYIPIVQKPVPLKEIVTIKYRIIDDDKHVSSLYNEAQVKEVSANSIIVETNHQLQKFDNLQIEYNGTIYGKVIGISSNNTYTIRLTTKKNSLVELVNNI